MVRTVLKSHTRGCPVQASLERGFLLAQPQAIVGDIPVRSDAANTVAQTADSGFPKGELSTTKNHTGNIWLSELNVGDSTFDPSIAMATYDAGAKLDWHVHPGGQVLLITEGTGYYQERGKPIQKVHKGDVIKCRPGVEHWHGATPNSGYADIAVTPNQKGITIWLEAVSDKDDKSLK